MKHYLFAILCGVVILAGTQAYAQSEKLAISDKAVTVITTASDSGALPGSKLYFLKDWRRSLKLFFVKDPVKRADIRLSNAFERVQDIQELLKVDVSDASKNSIGEILNQNDQDILYAKQVAQYAYRQKTLINEGKRLVMRVVEYQKKKLAVLELLKEKTLQLPSATTTSQNNISEGTLTEAMGTTTPESATTTKEIGATSSLLLATTTEDELETASSSGNLVEDVTEQQLQTILETQKPTIRQEKQEQLESLKQDFLQTFEGIKEAKPSLWR